MRYELLSLARSSCGHARWVAMLSCAMLACNTPKPQQTSRARFASVTAPASAPAADAADFQVATVGGQPIWASCVTAQAHAHHIEIRAALQQCIDFELLAQEATARGYQASQAVQAEFRAALANQFLAREFEDKTANFSQFPEDLQRRAFESSQWRKERENYRGSYFVRFDVAKGALPGSIEDQKAARAAKRVADALAGRHGLFPQDLRTAAIEAASAEGLAKPSGGDFKPSNRFQIVKSYGDALFALPAIGDVSPPTRTEWGWDLILFTSDLPARSITDDELREEIVPQMRVTHFAFWQNQLLGGRPTYAPNLEAIFDPEGTASPDAATTSGSAAPAR